MDSGLIAYAFTAGMVATVNPCGFAMLPAYISYYLATGEGERTFLQPASRPNPVQSVALSAEATIAARLLRALLIGATLTSGFVILFGLAGALISLGASAILSAMPWIGLLIGVALALLGGWLLLGHRLALPGVVQLPVRRERTLLSIFVFGVAYGLASLSCTLPVFLAVVGSAFAGRELGAGGAQFLAYGLGMGTVLTVLTLSVALFKGVLIRYLQRLVPYVERMGALLLLGAGGYIVYYWLTAGQLLRS